MAGSKNVLAVMGLICVNRNFRTDFLSEVTQACEQVFAALECTCPMPPCPCPDNEDLY
jgi:hypothetical protein